VRQCGVAAAEVQQALFELELEGRIAWYPGNRVARVSG
jgi:predicted Rossmann fold nucleotide-binding protein DprA/Smf involved in DNA uptake